MAQKSRHGVLSNSDCNRIQKSWPRRTYRCRRCGRIHEDWKHIFQCKSPQNRNFIHQAIQLLQTELCRIHTCPALSTCIITGISQWIQLLPSSFPSELDSFTDTFSAQLRSAFQQQSYLGWEQALRGRLCNSWSIVQDLYCQERQLKSLCYSNIHSSRMVQQLFSFSLSVWHNRNEFSFGSTTTESDER